MSPSVDQAGGIMVRQGYADVVLTARNGVAAVYDRHQLAGGYFGILLKLDKSLLAHLSREIFSAMVHFDSIVSGQGVSLVKLLEQYTTRSSLANCRRSAESSFNENAPGVYMTPCRSSSSRQH